MIKLLDGAMGTMIASRTKMPKFPETLNTAMPELVREIHREYVEAGSEYILAATFTSNGLRAAKAGYDLRENIAAAIRNARDARAPKVGLDVTTMGDFIEPYGDLTESEVRRLYREIASCAQGADYVALETMTELRETRIAAEELKSTGLPLFVTMTFTRDGKTFTGASPADAVRELGELADAIGLNCSFGPVEALSVLREFREATELPLIAKPNAGMPDNEGKYSMSPEEFAEAAAALAEAGAEYIGGCCGTSPEYIRALRERLS